MTRSLDPKGTGQHRWAARWKPALNAFAVATGHKHHCRYEKALHTSDIHITETIDRAHRLLNAP